MYFNTRAAASTKGRDLGIHQCKHRIKSGSGAVWVWMYDHAQLCSSVVPSLVDQIRSLAADASAQ